MMKNHLYGSLLAFSACFMIPAIGQETAPTSSAAEASQTYNDAYGEQLGSVHLPVSCNETAGRRIERGLALLHHMTYEGARAAFAAAAEADPDCAMAHWGQAMSFIHPLWSDPPSEAEFQQGQALLEQARNQGPKTEREQAYIAAVEAYYAAGHNRDESTNLSAFEQAWKKVHRQFPDDLEAAAFYALAHMASAKPADKSYTRQKQAAAIAEKLLAENPDHPGAHHYIIHANDYPPLAEEALEVAHNYGAIAPAIPHALHMPSHIFTRVGLWQDSIVMNQRSAEAALKHSADNKVSLHYPHALDYLAYAYLQRAEDEKAKQVLDTLKAVEDPFQPHVASAYTLAAVPARIALERQQWAEAASLEPRVLDQYPWDKFPAMEAITYFARALGAARSGDEETARQALDKLESLQGEAAKTSAYWAKQVEIQRLSALAWLEYQQGNKEQALATMEKAAELEASTEKHPVTPGEILPAQELLGDMLLALGRYEAAQTAYEAALERSPRRFNSLYGAGRAAEMAGDKDTAVMYYQQLIELVAADAERERLQQARAFLATSS